MFSDWCEIDIVASPQKKLYRLSEKPSGRDEIIGELIERVRSHYDNLERIAADVERLGFPMASAVLRERMPRTRRARSGELGEIIAIEFIENHTHFRIPTRRLRYKDGRDMALRGDDFIGVYKDERERLWLLKGESKSRISMSRDVVRDARDRLSDDDGRPTPISLLFVADRLLDSADDADRSLGYRIRDEIALKTVPSRRITHGLFALSENPSDAALQADLRTAVGTHGHVSIGFRIDGHREFIGDIFEQAGTLGDN